MKRVAFLVLVLALSGCAQTQSVAQKGEVISCANVPSDSLVTDGTLVECVDGSKGLALESLRGPMVVNVWGSWCASCLDEIPDFVGFYAKAKGKVSLVGVAVEESSPENSKRFIGYLGQIILIEILSRVAILEWESLLRGLSHLTEK
jgi:thiol-disulfide isomerase/thioredoxin